MRRPRIKADDRPIFYHLYNRVAGQPGFLPFGPAEKQHFVGLLHRLNTFFTVKVVAYQVMGNHFHLVVHAPDAPPEPEEVCSRYETYYNGRRKLKPDDPRCKGIGKNMRDISYYMHYLQHQFSSWYNREHGRRGALWAERYKHTLLGDAQAVWECIKYVEMNAVRAHMVEDPSDYRFSSYGAWCGKGRHPFEQNVRDVLLPWMEGLYPFKAIRKLRRSLRDAFKELTGVREEVEDVISTFRVDVNRRVRYWVDGLVIGSELFVREMMSHHRHALRPRTRLTRARGPDDEALALYCYKQLRAA